MIVTKDIPLIKVRLSDGRHSHEGRVEVWYEGKWGNICGYQWGMENADVVCRQLGFMWALTLSPCKDFVTYYLYDHCGKMVKT